MKQQDAIKIIIGPLLVLMLNEFSLTQDFYERFATYDVGMHALGGAAIALSWVILNRSLFSRLPRPLWYEGLVTLGIVSFAAIMWEFYEFTLNLYGPISGREIIVDTIGDFAAGLMGGLFVVGWYYLRHDLSAKE